MAFDPLDGSSIVDTNFTVGTIFGVYPGDKFLGKTGRDQVGFWYNTWGWGSRKNPWTPQCVACGGALLVGHSYVRAGTSLVPAHQPA